MKVGSLFSGIGGLDLGLERAGMTVAWQSEIDPYACKVLKKHWPHVPNLGDITTIDWSTVEPVDLICGGYPCQPFSLAGARAGENDARHLWPYFADALCVVRPRWALLENVPGHLSMGFGEVLADLADIGYDTQWDCIPAAAVGAPHLRYRVFVVAHAHGRGEPGCPVDAFSRSRLMVPDTGSNRLRQQPVAIRRRSRSAVTELDGASWPVAFPGEVRRGASKRDVPTRQPDAPGSGTQLADTDGEVGDTSRPTSQTVLRPATIERSRRRSRSVPDTDREPTRRVAVARRQRGQWATEPDVGRVAHGVPSRVDRLKCLGNAVVPAVAEYVGKRILDVA